MNTEDYEEYLKKYAKDHDLNEEEAEKHLIVGKYKEYLVERDRDVVVNNRG